MVRDLYSAVLTVANLYSVFDSMPRSLFKRCVQCPSTPPSCPSCASDETCQLVSQSCNDCASTKCVKIGSLPGQLATKPKTPIGPIVGGVIAGVVVVAIVVFLVWRFVIRPRRRAMGDWEPAEKRDQSTLSRAVRQSTAQSIASTVMTRASNVIQIAYIPGITVRSPPDSPGLPAPPIPPMPGSHNNSGASTPALEQHFFMPGDLRDSTWSDASSFDQRVSIAPSLVRSTVYGEAETQVVPPIPAQHAFRAHANMVSVRSGSTTPSSNSRTPAAAQMPSMSPGSSPFARQVVARPVEIKKTGSGPRVPTLANLAKKAPKKDAAGASERNIPVFFDEKEVVTPDTESPIIKPQPSFATIDSARSSSVSAIMPSEGPLGSGNSQPFHRHSKSEGLNAMIEEAINRARDPSLNVGRPDASKHDASPFSDANEVEENIS